MITCNKLEAKSASKTLATLDKDIKQNFHSIIWLLLAKFDQILQERMS